MLIDSIRHKALRKFAETGSTKGLPSGSIDRLRNMLAYLAAMAAEEELLTPPNFGAHRLTGVSQGRMGADGDPELANDVPDQRGRRDRRHGLGGLSLMAIKLHHSIAVHPGLWLRAEIVEPAGLALPPLPSGCG